MNGSAIRGAWAALLVASLRAAPALGAAPLVELEWNAPAECPQREEILREVERLVENAPAESLRVKAAVAAGEDGGFEVHLELSGAAEGTRTLDASTCRTVARAAALVIALSIDPQAASVASESMSDEGAPAPDDPAPVVVPPAVPAPPALERAPAPPPAPTPERALGGLLLVGLVGESGLLPRPGLGGAVGGGVAWRALRTDLTLELVPRSRVAPRDAGAPGALFWLAGTSARGCGGRVGAAVSVHACLAFRSSVLQGQGTGVALGLTQRAFVPAVQPGLLLGVPVTEALGVELDAAAVVPLVRPRFVVEDIATGARESLFRPGPVGAQARATVRIAL